MIRRPPRSTLDRSSAASDVYKRQLSTSVLITNSRRLGPMGILKALFTSGIAWSSSNTMNSLYGEGLVDPDCFSAFGAGVVVSGWPGLYGAGTGGVVELIM